jgi:predicted Zn-dependent protease
LSIINSQIVIFGAQKQNAMNTIRSITAIFLLAVITLSSCSKVPITGRRQVSLIPASQLHSMSYQQYNDFLKEHTLSNNEQNTALVKGVGQRMQQAVEAYFAEADQSSVLEGFEWDFNLVAKDELNAWAMPGGKIVFYEGILPATRNEAGIAVVMGHEIGHVVAGHGNERMSQMLMTQLGGMALSVAIHDKPEETQALWLTAFGIGSQVGVILPYSRLHEYEADKLGLIFMAMAGYDPHEAIRFWDRMIAMKSNPSPPEFISTHPADSKRMREMSRLIPEAMKYYRPAK